MYNLRVFVEADLRLFVPEDWKKMDEFFSRVFEFDESDLDSTIKPKRVLEDLERGFDEIGNVMPDTKKQEVTDLATDLFFMTIKFFEKVIQFDAEANEESRSKYAERVDALCGWLASLLVKVVRYESPELYTGRVSDDDMVCFFWTHVSRLYETELSYLDLNSDKKRSIMMALSFLNGFLPSLLRRPRFRGERKKTKNARSEIVTITLL